MSIPSLFNRTYYSFLNSSLSIEDIVQYAFANDHSYVVISDFENAHAWYKFVKLAKKRGLIPVLGLQLHYKNSSVLLLAKNKEGYRKLLKLSSNKDLLSVDNFDHMVFIHLDGEDYFEHVDKYVANSDKPNGVYIRENKFLKAEDFDFYCLLQAIKNNSSLSSELELNDSCRGDYLEKELSEELLDSHKVKNVHEILNQCVEYEFLDMQDTLAFHEDPESTLKSLLYESFEKLELPEDKQEIYKNRLQEELSVIVDKGFCEYFLIVWDAINWSKNNSVYIGPGRGSVCGSLVAYVLGITEIDPIKYELYFERFLNPTRFTIPDIDIDVASDRREELFLYLKDKYGPDHVALIAVYKTFKAKNSVREVLTAYGVKNELIEACLKNINQNDEINFEHQSFQSLFQNFPSLEGHLRKIQNYPINLSIHAAGVIISSVPISEFMPTVTSSSPLMSTQWMSEEIKGLGFVKFDFLSLQYLTVLNNMESRLRKRNVAVDWQTLDFDDAKVFETLILGRNSFIFQFEHEKVKKLIQRFKPNSLLDLALLSSINRPGASDQIPTLLARKSLKNSPSQHEGLSFLENNDEKNTFNHFQDTFGLLIYQEQLMKLVIDVTNCSVGESDSFRRQLSDRSKETASQQWFFKHASDRFSNPELLDLWDLISKFAKYSFNKSHAVAYAVISYRLLWIKTYYPDVFYLELLSLSINTSYFFEIEESGFLVSSPAYGKSDYDIFHFEDGVFYFPVNSISEISKYLTQEQYASVSKSKTSTIEAIREFAEFGVSMEALKLLIRAGFFSNLFLDDESELFCEANLQTIYDNAAYKKDGKPIFDLQITSVVLTEEDKQKYKNYKKELLDFDLTKPRINNKIFEKYKTLSKLKSVVGQINNPSKYIGFLSEVKESKTFRDSEFVWLTLYDGFFVSPRIAFFGEDPDAATLKEAAKQELPVVLVVEKNDYYRALKVKIIQQ